MSRYFDLWRLALSAPWPSYPNLCSKHYRKMLEKLDDLSRKGEMGEFGFFQDGIPGYLIGSRQATRTERGLTPPLAGGSRTRPVPECGTRTMVVMRGTEADVLLVGADVYAEYRADVYLAANLSSYAYQPHGKSNLFFVSFKIQ